MTLLSSRLRTLASHALNASRLGHLNRSAAGRLAAHRHDGGKVSVQLGFGQAGESLPGDAVAGEDDFGESEVAAAALGRFSFFFSAS